MLTAGQPAVQEQAPSYALYALFTLAEGSQQSKDAVLAAGAVPLLVASLNSDQRAVQEQAADALAQLAVSTERTSSRQWVLCLHF